MYYSTVFANISPADLVRSYSNFTRVFQVTKISTAVSKSACYLNRDSQSLLILNLYPGARARAGQPMGTSNPTVHLSDRELIYKYLSPRPWFMERKMKSWLKSCKRSFRTKIGLLHRVYIMGLIMLHEQYTRQTPAMMVWIYLGDRYMYVTHNVRISKTLPPKSSECISLLFGAIYTWHVGNRGKIWRYMERDMEMYD